MLEARLLVKLVEAKTLWDTPPHYTNDAQYVIKDAVAMSVDTEWEERLERIIDSSKPTYYQLLEVFIHNHGGSGLTKENLFDADHKDMSWKFSGVCQDNDKQANDHTLNWLTTLIEELCTAIGDKVHRRNLQIADLKRSVQVTENSLKRLMSTPPKTPSKDKVYWIRITRSGDGRTGVGAIVDIEDFIHSVRETLENSGEMPVGILKDIGNVTKRY